MTPENTAPITNPYQERSVAVEIPASYSSPVRDVYITPIVIIIANNKIE